MPCSPLTGREHPLGIRGFLIAEEVAIRRLRDALLAAVHTVTVEAVATALQIRSIYACTEGDHRTVEGWSDYGDDECTTLYVCSRPHCTYERRVRFVRVETEQGAEWEETA